jgi:pimeloyl-ACP methyl ester carboxylesterase
MQGQGQERAPSRIVTEDYSLGFNVPDGLMPDSRFDELDAEIQVHRIKPEWDTGQRPSSVPAVVLIHGRSVPGPVLFDLQYTTPGGVDLSLQRALAQAGIDTFAPSLLGYGKSTRFAQGLDDPGNASLRPIPPGATSCPPEFPEGCDGTLIPGINPLDQQGRMLLVNPLGALTGGKRRKHSSNFRFARTDVWVRDIDQVILDALQKAQPTGGKVALVGYSLGGQHVGRTLHTSNPFSVPGSGQLRPRPEIIAKVSRVAFVNSLFFADGPPGVPPVPPGPTDEPPGVRLPSFPLTLNDRLGSDVNWRMQGEPLGCEAACSGHIIPGTQERVWCQTLELDTEGRKWGGDDPNFPTGLNRAPTFSGYGWTTRVAGQLNKDALVIQGLEDTVVPTGVGSGLAIYNALHKDLGPPSAAMPNKVLVRVDCASHALVWEGCAGDRCTPASGTPYGGPPGAPWAGPHATLKAALIEWIHDGKFNGRENGRFIVNESGVAGDDPATAI